ncbi:unnamed protein product [Moneuplotes crassus]|uniref:Uncharacterized protein n=1 Tax=Euplotes crassus TaxID=5936 RepID=A0AAD1XEV3_EUPCR|nr:unnamed protein product [Moneuplotes crassus]
MQLRDAPNLYLGKSPPDDDLFVQRIRQDNMKEIIRQQILENKRAREAIRAKQEIENEQIKYKYSLKNKFQKMSESSERNHSRQLRRDIDSQNSVENLKKYTSKRMKKYADFDIAKSRSESRISNSSQIYSQIERKDKRFLFSKKDEVTGKVGDLNHSSPRENIHDKELSPYNAKESPSNLPPTQLRFLKKSMKKKLIKKSRIQEIISEENSIAEKLKKKASKNANINRTNGSIILRNSSYKELSPLNPGNLKHKTPKIPKKKEERFSNFPKEGNSFVVNNRVYKKFNIIGKVRNASPTVEKDYKFYNKRVHHDRKASNYNSYESLPKLQNVSKQANLPSSKFGYKKAIVREPEIGHLSSGSPNASYKKLPPQGSRNGLTREPKIGIKQFPPSSYDGKATVNQQNIVLSNDYGRAGRNNMLNKLVQEKHKHPTMIY